jgi:uncharacterized protein YtpQ (UPF0354 family)
MGGEEAGGEAMKWWSSRKREDSRDPMDAMTDPSVSREVFALLYAKLLQQRKPEIELEMIDTFSLRFEGQDGMSYTVGLENLWIQCHEEREEAKEAIERHLAVVANVGKPLIVLPESIFPMIKGQEYVDTLGEEPESKFAVEHLAADLWIAYNLRGDGSYSSLSWRELQEAGIAKESVKELAMQNLMRDAPDMHYDKHRETVVCVGGHLTASLLLLNHVWQWMEEEVLGQAVVVSVPVDHMVLCANANSPTAVVELREKTLQVFETLDNCVSPTLLKRVNGSWRSLS